MTIRTYPITCPSCEGTGFRELKAYGIAIGSTCPACNGSKWVMVSEQVREETFATYPQPVTDGPHSAI